MSVSQQLQRGQQALRRRMLANLKDCQPKTDWRFSPPIAPTEFESQCAEIRAEMRKTKPASGAN